MHVQTRTAQYSLFTSAERIARALLNAQELQCCLSSGVAHVSLFVVHILETHINFYDAQEKFGEQDHRAPITEEVKESGEIRTAGCSHSSPDSKISETSYFQSQMHFDDSLENIADSDLEDGELQKMLTSPLYALKASGETRCMVD